MATQAMISTSPLTSIYTWNF